MDVGTIRWHKFSCGVVPHQIRHIDIPVDLLRNIGPGDTGSKAHHNEIMGEIVADDLGGQHRSSHHAHLVLTSVHHTVFFPVPGETCFIIRLGIPFKGVRHPVIHMLYSSLLSVGNNDQCHGSMIFAHSSLSCHFETASTCPRQSGRLRFFFYVMRPARRPLQQVFHSVPLASHTVPHR